ncbi:NYN domain-containing protein [Buchananella felis]|uniref:NYN domain-containing protein n=1 Tax=Buchananella felis TaxID=3231492 RepID=UPI0035290E6E
MDTLIVTDLVELARNRAISDAVVVSGDEDIRIAVSLAQSFGLRVHLLGAGNIARNMSRTLRHEADTVAVLPEEWLKNHLEPAPENSAVGQSVQPEARSRVCAGQPEPEASRIQVDLEIVTGEELDESARRVAASLIAQVDARRLEQLRAQLESTGKIPSEFDRPFVGAIARLQGGGRLSGGELGKARKVFRQCVCANPQTR